MTKKSLFLISLLGFFIQRELGAQMVSFDFTEKKPRNAAVRSLMIPGWGQFFNGQTVKGSLMMGAEAAALASSLFLWNQARSTFDAYQAQGLKDSDLFNRYRRERNRSALAAGLGALIWTYAVLDAYWVGRSQVLASQKEGPSKGWTLAWEKDRTEILYEIHF